MSCTLGCVVLFAAASLFKVAQAEAFVLDTSQLPSQQGWTYDAFGNVAVEQDVFSVSSDGLRQDSTGTGFSSQAQNLYRRKLDSGSGPYFRITARVQIAGYVTSGSLTNAGGFSLGIIGPAGTAAVGIADTYFNLYSASTQVIPLGSFDTNSSFHQYVLEGRLEPGGSYSLFRDGSLIGSSPIWVTETTASKSIYFGDGTGGANARVFISSMSYIPEPTGLLVICPIIWLWGRRQTSRRR